jgi:hypothetical protein
MLAISKCHELSQSRYKSCIRWATTCTIGTSKYKNLKLRKKGAQGQRPLSTRSSSSNRNEVTCLQLGHVCQSRNTKSLN